MHKYVVVILVLVLLNECSSNNKLNVEVLFESLCPDSYRFIKDQLYPAWKEIKPFVNLKLVPFGKSSSIENGTKFICQHGPQECKGNRILSCALEMLHDPTLQVEYTNCFMSAFTLNRNNDQEFGQNCAQQVGLDSRLVIDCYNSDNGRIAQLKAEKETARIAPKFVPAIIFNGEFHQQLQQDSIVDFKGVICRLIKNPEICPSV